MVSLRTHSETVTRYVEDQVSQRPDLLKTRSLGDWVSCVQGLLKTRSSWGCVSLGPDLLRTRSVEIHVFVYKVCLGPDLLRTRSVEVLSVAGHPPAAAVKTSPSDSEDVWSEVVGERLVTVVRTRPRTLRRLQCFPLLQQRPLRRCW